MAFLDEVSEALSPGGLLDVPELGGTEGTLGLFAGANQAVSSLASGFIQSSGEKARARALQADAAAIAQSGRFAVLESVRTGRKVIGAQRAHRGFQGVTMSGSSLDVLAETAADAAWNTSVIAYNYKSHEQAVLYQARLARFNASQAKLQGIAGAIGAVGAAATQVGFLAGQIKPPASSRAFRLADPVPRGATLEDTLKIEVGPALEDPFGFLRSRTG